MSGDRGPRRRRRDAQERKPRSRNRLSYVWPASLVAGLIAIAWIGISALRWLEPAGGVVTVPSFVGQQYDAASVAAKAAHVQLRIVAHKPDYHAPKGRVVGQLPAAGEHVREGRVVDLIVSDGEPTAKVPNLANMSVRDATVVLENARLRVGQIDTKEDASVAEGTVLDQNPEAFANVPAGSRVKLTIAKGRPIVYAPNFVGLTLVAAVAAAKDAKIALLPAVQLPIAPSAPPKGVVTAQDPPAGEQLKTHEAITLQVSGGAPPVASPSPAPGMPSPGQPKSPVPSPTQSSLLPAPNTPRGLRVSVALPQSQTPVRVRVILLDATGSRTLYDQQTRGGFTLSFDVTVTGAGTLQTFVGDALVNATPL